MFYTLSALRVCPLFQGEMGDIPNITAGGWWGVTSGPPGPPVICT